MTEVLWYLKQFLYHKMYQHHQMFNLMLLRWLFLFLVESSPNFTISSTRIENLTATGSLTSFGSMTITGDAVIGGKVTAQEFHTEFVSSSIIATSGSTQFGDTFDDKHEFTGSLQISGSFGLDGVIINEFTNDPSLESQSPNPYLLSSQLRLT